MYNRVRRTVVGRWSLVGPECRDDFWRESEHATGYDASEYYTILELLYGGKPARNQHAGAEGAPRTSGGDDIDQTPRAGPDASTLPPSSEHSLAPGSAGDPTSNAAPHLISSSGPVLKLEEVALARQLADQLQADLDNATPDRWSASTQRVPVSQNDVSHEQGCLCFTCWQAKPAVPSGGQIATSSHQHSGVPALSMTQTGADSVLGRPRTAGNLAEMRPANLDAAAAGSQNGRAPSAAAANIVSQLAVEDTISAAPAQLSPQSGQDAPQLAIQGTPGTKTHFPVSLPYRTVSGRSDEVAKAGHQPKAQNDDIAPDTSNADRDNLAETVRVGVTGASLQEEEAAANVEADLALDEAAFPPLTSSAPIMPTRYIEWPALPEAVTTVTSPPAWCFEPCLSITGPNGPNGEYKMPICKLALAACVYGPSQTGKRSLNPPCVEA